MSIVELSARSLIKLVTCVKDSGELPLHKNLHRIIDCLKLVRIFALESSRLFGGIALRSSFTLHFNSMLKELESLIRGKGLLMLSLASQLCSLSLKKLSVVDVRVFFLEKPDFLVQVFLFFLGTADVAGMSLARVVIDDLASSCPEFFQLL